MLKNHIKIALRFFAKNKLFTIINISGLAIGTTAFLLLTQYVAFEKSYDVGLDNLYRVTLKNSRDVNDFDAAATNHPAVGPSMKADFPEVESYARLVDAKVLGTSGILSYQNVSGEVVKANSKDYKMYYADKSLLTMFDLPMAQGNSEIALSEPGSLLLSSKAARRFFGAEDPIGKDIVLNGENKIKVKGVFEDLPQNTHLQFDMLISFASLNQESMATTWVWPEFYNYVQLKPGTDREVVTAKLPDFIQKYLGEIMNEYGFRTTFSLQPVGDIHLKSHLNKEMSSNSSEGTLTFLIIVAAFVIVIALINFINLSTSKSLERAKEVGMKKVVGAKRSSLIYQFLCESSIINFIAIIIALVLAGLLMQPLNTLVELEVISIATWSKPSIWIIVLSIFMTGGILAGLYPAFVLSSFKPITVLKGKFHKSTKGSLLRKGLVVAQFAVSIALISGTYIVYDQFSFMRDQELGFEADKNLVINAPIAVDSTVSYKMEVFVKELLRYPDINSVTATSDIPGKPLSWSDGLRIKGKGKEDHVPLNFMAVDPDFLDTYKIDLLAGRNFSKEDVSQFFQIGENGDTNLHRVLLNAFVVKSLGYATPQEAIGQRVVFKYGPVERTAEVIGVVENYHQQSLQADFENIMLVYSDRYRADYVTININGSNVNGSIATIEEKFDRLFPNDLFTFFFLDDYFDRQYRADLKFSTICLLFSVLAIFIAALGLFGLGSHMALEKIKEISVRKVMGATVTQALAIIPKRLLGLVLIAGAIALPIIYLITKKWLENYAFKIQINIWMFLTPLLIVMVVAAISILAQSLKSALVNPAEALRNE